jgi:Spy/CpxP family protein refolding chaperone
MAAEMSFVRGSAVALFLLAWPLAAAPPASAQPEAPPASGANADPIAQRVFPPELVMGHADEIGLTPDQRGQIVAAVSSLQQQANGLGPRMAQARGQMVADLDAEPADETRVLAALDGVLAVERDVKRLEIGMLVRIRNILTPAQRTRLAALR